MLILYLYSVLMVMLTLNIMKFSKKKLVTLMMLELFMYMLIMTFSMDHFSLKNSVFFMIMFAIFMVLDSVFGICTLISNTRNNSILSSYKIIF